MKRIFSKKNFLRLTVLFILALITIVFLWRYLNTYLTRSKASESSVTLSLIPGTLNFNNQEVKEIDLIAQFQNGSAGEKIDYLKVQINFPKDNLGLIDHIDTTNSSLGRRIRVDEPPVVNNGQIVIELGAFSPGGGPATNSGPVTIAKIKFNGKLNIQNGTIAIGNVEIYNNLAVAISQITKNNTIFSVTSGPTSTPVPACSDNCSVDIDCPSGLICYQPPMPKCAPGKECIQVMPHKVCRNLSCKDSANCLCATPTPTATPISPTSTPRPPTVTPRPPTVTPRPPTVTPKPPTVTPRPPTVTLIPPTTTSAPGCDCDASSNCTSVCPVNQAANQFSDVTYANPIKCSLSDSLFATAPSTANKTSWCQATKRTKGDADGNGVINNADYFYYVAAANGGKIPVTVNPDFNGDGEVGLADRTIVVKSLKSLNP